jgi:hypothetical protein
MNMLFDWWIPTLPSCCLNQAVTSEVHITTMDADMKWTDADSNYNTLVRILSVRPVVVHDAGAGIQTVEASHCVRQWFFMIHLLLISLNSMKLFCALSFNVSGCYGSHYALNCVCTWISVVWYRWLCAVSIKWNYCTFSASAVVLVSSYYTVWNYSHCDSLPSSFASPWATFTNCYYYRHSIGQCWAGRLGGRCFLDK